jgi:sugar lactone lactonase YvrE
LQDFEQFVDRLAASPGIYCGAMWEGSMPETPRVVLEGLWFPEGPRWHDGALYFSDMHGRAIWRMASDGRASKIGEFDDEVSGLGWLPDGTMLAVSMSRRHLLRLTRQRWEVASDLSAHVANPINDMVVDRLGRAYVGGFGFDVFHGEAPRTTGLLCVEPGGRVRMVADGLNFPNGMVITPDGKTLIVAETLGARLSAFDVEPDGALANRRDFAAFEGLIPDGICLDAEGAVWAAWPGSNKVVRLRDGGAIADTIDLPGRQAYACVLGGADGRDLYICTALDYVPDVVKAKAEGKIEVTRVEVPGAGLP